MKILALETATEACSAALLDGEQLFSRFELLPQGHSSRILGMCGEVLEEAGVRLADIDAVAFGRGPGSFTGLRIGASVAQGLATGAGCGVIAISSLAALAQACQARRVWAALDARMGEVYSGFYERDEGGRLRLVGSETVARPADPGPPEGGSWTAVGTAFAQYADMLDAGAQTAVELLPGRYPEAASVAWLAREEYHGGGALAPDQAIPVYLRDNVAKRPTERKQADVETIEILD